MAGRRAVFRRFSDSTAEVGESAVQAALGAVGAGVGVLLVVTADRHSPLRWGWLIIAGAAWAAWSLRRMGRNIRRVRALRSAVPAVARVVAVHPRNSYADEWYLRRYADVDLLVTLPGTAPRTLRERVALAPAQLAQLTAGTEVAVQVHPTRPAVWIQWTGGHPPTPDSEGPSPES